MMLKIAAYNSMYLETEKSAELLVLVFFLNTALIVSTRKA